MRVILNGDPHETQATALDALLKEIELTEAAVATAVNGEFVAAEERPRTALRPGDSIEVLAPMQGG